MVVWRLPSGWSAPEALAQHREDQEGLEVGADLAVFSKDLCLRLALGWMDGKPSNMWGGGTMVSNNFSLNPKQMNEATCGHRERKKELGNANVEKSYS